MRFPDDGPTGPGEESVTAYDRVADCYDDHFDRPVDRWEDERLTELLAPHVNRQSVLDLGCGTGWLLDHLDPYAYTGVDCSAAMLERLSHKHPWASTVKATVGQLGWWAGLDEHACQARTVTATWSAHELGEPALLLAQLAQMFPPRTMVCLHGQGPRYRHRRHYVLPEDDRRGYLRWTPEHCKMAASRTGHDWLGAVGTGAWPDALAWHPPWRATLGLPARWHYAFLAMWRLR